MWPFSTQKTRQVKTDRRARSSFRPRLEFLEDRTLLSAYVVTTTADSGPGSLRDAITQINADTSHALYASPSNPSVDEIDFNITAASDAAGGGTGYNATTGVATITPNSGLLYITNSVILDGTSQPGYAGSPLIALNGAGAGPGVTGLTISAGSSTVEGLGIYQFSGDGIDLTTNGGNLVQKNYIGTDITGTQALGNNNGIVVLSADNTVGGAAPGAGNVISGNTRDGVELSGSANFLQGNIIGLDAAGDGIVGNSAWGVLVEGSGNTIGGADTNASGVPLAGAGNVISGQTSPAVDSRGYADGVGIVLFGAGNLVQGNYIGTDKTGEVALGNAATGIYDFSGGNTIGGPALVPTGGGLVRQLGNVISGNGVGIDSAGVSTIEGNYIGTDSQGTAPLGNGEAFFVRENGLTIGGTASGAGNLISGNGSGVRLESSNNQVQGNLLGTDYTGTKGVGNGTAVVMQDGGNNNVIGGLDTNAPGQPLAGGGNIISGNGLGIYLSFWQGATPMSGNLIEGNYIGTDVTGTQAVGNDAGVVFADGVSGNTIGGTTASARNVISGNSGIGVSIGPNGNPGILPSNNVVEGNSIHDNGGLGIDLVNGANDNQAAPVLTLAISSGTGTAISGTLAGSPGASYRIEFFSNQTAAAGQGQTFLGFAQVTTDVTGNAAFSLDLATATDPGTLISATATDPSGNTSEFAADVTTQSLAVSAGGPYSSAEGNGVTFTASPTATVFPLTYTWTVNGHIVLGDNGGANPTLTLTWVQLQALGIDDGPSSFALSVAVDDGHGDTATSPATTLSLANTPPTAALSGPSSAVIYQPLTFTLGATDPSTTDQAAGFTYVVNWGDGTTGNVFGPSGTTDTHSYSSAGSYTIALTATDKDDGVSTAVTQTVAIVATPQLQNGVLVVPGTAGNDTFTLTPVLPTGATAYSMKVSRMTGGVTTTLGTFAVPTGIIEIYGGPGSDAVTLSGTSANDAFTEGNGSVAVQLATDTAATTSFTVGLNGMTAVTLKGAGGSDSLTGPNQANTWAITAANAGTLDGSTSFSGIQNLTGGTGADVFSFTDNTASLAGMIDGGGGSDTLDYSGSNRLAVTVTMEAAGRNKATAVNGGWQNIGTVIGSGAMNAVNTLVGANTINTWDLTGRNAGTLDGALTFSGFQNLTGGSVDDTFVFLPGGSVSGALNGGAPTNTLDYSQYGSPVTVNLQTKTATAIGGAWTNIQKFVVAGTTDTLIGPGTPTSTTTWTLSGVDSGTVGAFSFMGFANLTGGVGNDVFKFNDGAGVTGVIDGGGGTNTLNYALYSTGIFADLQTLSATGTGGIADIQNVTGGQGSDILVGDANANVLLEKAGKAARDLIIGGGGVDALTAGSGGDILIAGYTDYDTNVAALDALLAAWNRTDLSYSQRVMALQSGVTYTDTTGTHTAELVADGTVHPRSGSSPSTLTGGSGLDWFFASLGDAIKNKSGKTVNYI